MILSCCLWQEGDDYAEEASATHASHSDVRLHPACLRPKCAPRRYNLFGQDRIKRQLRTLIEQEELLTALPAQRFPLIANGGAPFLDQQEQAAQQAQTAQPEDDILADATVAEDDMAVEVSDAAPQSPAALAQASSNPEQPSAARSRKARFL